MAKISQETIQKSLKSNKPESIAALLLWTKQPDVWAKAKELMSTSPEVAASLALSSTSNADKVLAASSLLALDPSNPLAYAILAEQHLRNGDQDSANELLKGLKLDAPVTAYVDKIIASQAELLKSSGYDSVDQTRLLSQDKWQQGLVNTIEGLSSACFKNSDDETKVARASMILGIIDGYRSDRGELLPEQISDRLSGLEETTLRRLPDDFLLEGDITVADRAAEIAAKRLKLLDRRRKVSEALSQFDSGGVEEYYNILAKKGSDQASKWLLGE